MEISKTAELVLSLDPVIISPLIYVDDQATEAMAANQLSEGYYYDHILIELMANKEPSKMRVI